MFDGILNNYFNATKKQLRRAINDYCNKIFDLGSNRQPEILWAQDEDEPQEGLVSLVWKSVYTPPWGGVTFVSPWNNDDVPHAMHVGDIKLTGDVPVRCEITYLSESKAATDFFQSMIHHLRVYWSECTGDAAPGQAGGSGERIQVRDWVKPNAEEARSRLYHLGVKGIDRQDRIIKLAENILAFKIDRSKVELLNRSRYDSDKRLAKKAGLIPPNF